MKETVKIELKTRKSYSGIVYNKGDIVDAKIDHRGFAKVDGKPFVELRPEQYDVYIAEQEYSKLLGH